MAQGLVQEMTMEDRRAEAIRQVHEQEAMMQRNTACQMGTRTGNQARIPGITMIARGASNMVSFVQGTSNPLALSLLEVRLYGPISVTTRSRNNNETLVNAFRGS